MTPRMNAKLVIRMGRKTQLEIAMIGSVDDRFAKRHLLLGELRR